MLLPLRRYLSTASKLSITLQFDTHTPAMALTAEEIKALEQLRGRLSHLATSLATAKTDLERSDPVPSW